jgi:uncharacterized protein (TIGR02246 family)
MKQLLRGWLIVVLGCGCVLQAQTKADEVAVRAVPQAFAAGWAKHDGHQVAKIMDENVDFVNVGGDWTRGRADFELYTTRLLSGRFKDSKLSVLDVSVRFLRPNIAVLHWSWKTEADRSEDGTTRPPRRGLFTMIVEKRHQDWLVTVAQNTNWVPGKNPEMNGITPGIAFPDIEEKH